MDRNIVSEGNMEALKYIKNQYKDLEIHKFKSGSEFYSSKCTACHGADGNMGIAGAKKLPESTLALEEREAIITIGKGTMPAFKNQLDAASIKVVAEYTLTLK